jgi:hypothetical protein
VSAVPPAGSQAPAPRTRALDAEEWFVAYCEVEGENRELRRMLTDLIIWVAQRDDLFAVIRRAIEAKWTEDRG